LATSALAASSSAFNLSVSVISAGFGESGPEGRERERRLREKILSYGMRVVGPNCLGVLNNSPDVRLNATFSPVIAPSGNLSIGSQSGALGLALLDHANFGNRIDIATDDLLEYWEDDKNTDVIVLYQESFGNPRKFGRIAKRISHKKPIIAVFPFTHEDGSKSMEGELASERLITVLAEKLVARNEAKGYKSKDAWGLSIHFPYFYMNYREKYEHLSLSRDTRWDEMIKAAVFYK